MLEKHEIERFLKIWAVNAAGNFEFCSLKCQGFHQCFIHHLQVSWGKIGALVLAEQDCGRVGVFADFLLTRFSCQPTASQTWKNAEISTVDGCAEFKS